MEAASTVATARLEVPNTKENSRVQVVSYSSPAKPDTRKQASTSR
jgi:hypothetical protein